MNEGFEKTKFTELVGSKFTPYITTGFLFDMKYSKLAIEIIFCDESLIIFAVNFDFILLFNLFAECAHIFPHIVPTKRMTATRNI